MLDYIRKSFLLLLFGCSFVFAGTFVVEWDAVVNDTSGKAETGTIYYQVYGQTFPAFPVVDENFLGVTTGTTFSYTDTSIVDDSSHFFFRVVAMDEWGNSSEVSRVTGTTSFVLAFVKVFLQGAYDVDGDTMRTTLRQNNILPLSSPYSAAPRTITEMPVDIVDWVCVGLRSEATGVTVSLGSYLLKNDGTIVEEDGSTSEIGLPGVGNGEYFITVQHRNQIVIMSDLTNSLNDSSTILYNFVDSINRYRGSNSAAILGENIYGMWAGDITQDGEITTADYTAWYNSAQSGVSGYSSSDLNLDGNVTTSDYTMWYNNARTGASSGVP